MFDGIADKLGRKISECFFCGRISQDHSEIAVQGNDRVDLKQYGITGIAVAFLF